MRKGIPVFSGIPLLSLPCSNDKPQTYSHTDGPDLSLWISPNKKKDLWRGGRVYRGSREVEGESSQSVRCTYEKLLKQTRESERTPNLYHQCGQKRNLYTDGEHVASPVTMEVSMEAS